MKIVIDNKVPFVEGVFEPYADVLYRSGSAISADDLMSADAMIIRTRTSCNADLLEGARKLKIIATATIGYDHIDTAYCAARGIEVATSAGCNARAVAQWLFSALVEMGACPPRTLGVVGVGNVGSVVSAVGRSLGYRVLCCDPPRAAAEGGDGFVTLDELLGQSDIVTLHVPLSESTRDMADAHFFERLRHGAIFANSSRGEVVDERALVEALSNGRVSRAAIDVWRHEPRIDLKLLNMCRLATPHIAGYSIQGKAMGTAMAVRSVAHALGLPIAAQWYPDEHVTRTTPRTDLSWDEMSSLTAINYPISHDDTALRANPEQFERLREEYRFRQEFF